MLAQGDSSTSNPQTLISLVNSTQRLPKVADIPLPVQASVLEWSLKVNELLGPA
jgi:hypothetical protein